MLAYEMSLDRKKPRQIPSKIKVLLTVFYDYRGLAYYEFLPPNQTVNMEAYRSLRITLRKAAK